MRLTVFLMRKKMPNGHIWRGKHRLYKYVTEKVQSDQRDQFAHEENNMLLLRHPFLTLEQSHGHAKALGKSEQWHANVREINATFKKPITIEERLRHLRVSEAWD